MTKEVATNNVKKRKYLKEDHQGVIVDKKKIKGMGWSFFVLSLVFFMILIFGGWTSCFGADKELTRAMGIIGIIVILLLELWDLCNSKKLIGVFEGDLNDLINGFKVMGVYLNHHARESEYYEVQAEPITSFRKKLLIVKDCGSFCEITSEKNYMEYLARYLVDLKLK